jgi:hypothetical protein
VVWRRKDECLSSFDAVLGTQEFLLISGATEQKYSWWKGEPIDRNCLLEASRHREFDGFEARSFERLTALHLSSRQEPFDRGG